MHTSAERRRLAAEGRHWQLRPMSLPVAKHRLRPLLEALQAGLCSWLVELLPASVEPFA